MTAMPPPRAVRTWQDAESNAAAWMRFWGFSSARVTQSGADGGFDVVAGRAVAQVKFQASQVGRPDLQRLVGAMGRDRDRWALFFTGSGYSRTASTYAAELGIALFVYRLDGTMEPQNENAWTLVRARRSDVEVQQAMPSGSPLLARELRSLMDWLRGEHVGRTDQSTASGRGDSVHEPRIARGVLILIVAAGVILGGLLLIAYALSAGVIVVLDR